MRPCGEGKMVPMRKIALLTLVLMLFASLANAAFTVDKRSFYHVGVSAGISMAVNTFAVEAKIPERNRNIIAFATAFGAGMTKEVFIDDHIDWGDVTFNAIGALGGIYISEKYFITPMEHGAIVGVRW